MYDVAGPQLLAEVAFSALVVYIGFTLVVALLEALVLRLSGWNAFRRSLISALAANAVTTLIGAISLYFVYEPTAALLLIDLVVSVVVEAGVLLLFKRESGFPSILVHSLRANMASYIFIILPLFAWYMYTG